jgi:hypothetical protein
MTTPQKSDAPAANVKYPLIDPIGNRTVELSLEQRFAVLHNIFKLQYFATWRLIGERFGWDTANELSGQVSAEATPFLAESYRRKFDLPGHGAALVSQVLQAEFQAEGSDADVLIENDDEARIDVLCGFGSALQRPKYADIPITDGLCEKGCRIWLQEIAATVEPDLRAERETWMGDGAPRCRYHIYRETGEAGSR